VDNQTLRIYYSRLKSEVTVYWSEEEILSEWLVKNIEKTFNNYNHFKQEFIIVLERGRRKFANKSRHMRKRSDNHTQEFGHTNPAEPLETDLPYLPDVMRAMVGEILEVKEEVRASSKPKNARTKPTPKPPSVFTPVATNGLTLAELMDKMRE
jgi:hypothetical protein